MADKKNNLEHWDALGKTDPKHTKSFTRGGGFKGTAMKPIWIIKMLTEHFGPIGEGFGMGEPRFEVIPSPATEKILVYCWVECWHSDPSNTFWGVGGDSVQDKFRSGPYADDEAFKKAYTDAVNNAFKFVGVGADIHMGQFDDSKYVDKMKEAFDDTPPAVAKVKEMSEKIAMATDEDTLQAIAKEYAADIEEAKKQNPAIVTTTQTNYKRKLKQIRESKGENE